MLFYEKLRFHKGLSRFTPSCIDEMLLENFSMDCSTVAGEIVGHKLVTWKYDYTNVQGGLQIMQTLTRRGTCDVKTTINPTMYFVLKSRGDHFVFLLHTAKSVNCPSTLHGVYDSIVKSQFQIYQGPKLKRLPHGQSGIRISLSWR